MNDVRLLALADECDELARNCRYETPFRRVLLDCSKALRAAPVSQCDAEPMALLFRAINFICASSFISGHQAERLRKEFNEKFVAMAIASFLAAPARCDAGSVEAFNRGAREGWMRCGAFHVDIDFEGRPEAQAEIDQRWPLAAPPALPAGEEADENALWALACELHSNVPEDQRPMSWSDFSPEQIERLHRAANAFLRALSSSSNGKPAT